MLFLGWRCFCAFTAYLCVPMTYACFRSGIPTAHQAYVDEHAMLSRLIHTCSMVFGELQLLGSGSDDEVLSRGTNESVDVYATEEQGRRCRPLATIHVPNAMLSSMPRTPSPHLWLALSLALSLTIDCTLSTLSLLPPASSALNYRLSPPLRHSPRLSSLHIHTSTTTKQCNRQLICSSRITPLPFFLLSVSEGMLRVFM